MIASVAAWFCHILARLGMIVPFVLFVWNVRSADRFVFGVWCDDGELFDSAAWLIFGRAPVVVKNNKELESGAACEGVVSDSYLFEMTVILKEKSFEVIDAFWEIELANVVTGKSAVFNAIDAFEVDFGEVGVFERARADSFDVGSREIEGCEAGAGESIVGDEGDIIAIFDCFELSAVAEDAGADGFGINDGFFDVGGSEDIAAEESVAGNRDGLAGDFGFSEGLPADVVKIAGVEVGEFEFIARESAERGGDD